MVCYPTGSSHHKMGQEVESEFDHEGMDNGQQQCSGCAV